MRRGDLSVLGKKSEFCWSQFCSDYLMALEFFQSAMYLRRKSPIATISHLLAGAPTVHNRRNVPDA